MRVNTSLISPFSQDNNTDMIEQANSVSCGLTAPIRTRSTLDINAFSRRLARADHRNDASFA
jgi:hypothetical protein